MTIGLLKEPAHESRVAMLPENVKPFVDLKQEVWVEAGAGEKAYNSDEAYQKVGAQIRSRAEILAKADILLSIHALEVQELDQIPAGRVRIGQMAPFIKEVELQASAQHGHVVFSLDMIPRSTRAQAMDVLSSMATVSGYKAVLDAAGMLPHFFPLFMSAAGTIRPAKMLIIGAGVAGLQAVATGRKLGAVVEVSDVRAAAKEEVLSLGGKFLEVAGAKDDASAGGYAVEQTEEFKQKQRQLLYDHAVKANVILCTAQVRGGKAPVIITRAMVDNMAPGSVIIDLAASTGGNCELTQDGQTIVHNGVRVVGQSNYPSLMPSDASKMFGKNMENFLKLFYDKEGQFALRLEDDILQASCICRDGAIAPHAIKK